MLKSQNSGDKFFHSFATKWRFLNSNAFVYLKNIEFLVKGDKFSPIYCKNVEKTLIISLPVSDRNVMSLTELAAREVASSIPFELVEHYFPPVPEELQLRIAFWSFPEQVSLNCFLQNLLGYPELIIYPWNLGCCYS
jgi:hypothetical protein